MLNQKFRLAMLSAGLLFFAAIIPAHAQSVEDVRWKSEAQVRAKFGQPESVKGPVGTHASYTLWNYQNFVVAFANNRAFHLFNKNSLKKVVLEENR